MKTQYEKNEKTAKFFFGLGNLQSIREMLPVELRPITILVGENSTGKSSFLRSIPLICQSIEASSSSPIAWSGNLVDFGNLESAVNKTDSKNGMSLKFKVENMDIKSCMDLDPQKSGKLKAISCENIDCEIVIGGKNNHTVREMIGLEISSREIETEDGGFKAEFHFSENNSRNHIENGIDRVIINNENIFEFISNRIIEYNKDTIFSEFKYVDVTKKYNGKNLNHKLIIEDLVEILKHGLNMLEGEIDASVLDNVYKEAYEIISYPNITNKIIKVLLKKSDFKPIMNLYEFMLKNRAPELVNKINGLCALHWALESLNALCGIFGDFFQDVSYIGPAKWGSERFYRFQELNDSRISPDGNNLHMFLVSLAQKGLLTHFSDWVRKLLGFSLSVEKNVDPIKIYIQRNGMEVNIADAGTGVSQILPIIAQIWNESWNNSDTGQSKISHRCSCKGYSEYMGMKAVVLEQPELHLHPAYQAIVAEMLALAVSNDGNRKSRFFVETHSDKFLNRLGDLVEYGKLSPDDIQVLMFSIDHKNSTTVKVSYLNEKGEFDENWPYGFMEYRR